MGGRVGFGDLTGYLAGSGEGQGGAGLVVLHEWWGLVPHVEDLCDRFAALGFTALAPDLSRGASAGDEPDEAERLMMAMHPDRAIASTRARSNAFSNETWPDSYDEAAAQLSWDRTVAFLRRHLG